jgi:hypothetical protein
MRPIRQLVGAATIVVTSVNALPAAACVNPPKTGQQLLDCLVEKNAAAEAKERRTDEAARAYCSDLDQRTRAFRDCFSAARRRLQQSAIRPEPVPSQPTAAPTYQPAVPAAPAALARPSMCDPAVAQQVVLDKAARAGVSDPGVIWEATMQLLEAYGCIARR